MHTQDNIPPLVSVWMITYNHEPFIAQAIESVLKQKTTFSIELVIGEDCSTDGTAQIVKEYADKFQEVIKARFNNPNIGMIPNMIKTLDECKGKYIAMLEGDDYWTNEYKLQEQVDFLENNLSYSGVVHDTDVMYEKNQIKQKFPQPDNEIITIKDLLATRIFHTASLLYRAEITRTNKLPNAITSADRALFLLIASSGNIKFQNKTMCCYRKTDIGISSWVTVELLEKDLNIVPWISKINPYFPQYKYCYFIHYTILTYPKFITKRKVISHSFYYILYSFSNFPKNIKSNIRFLLYELPQIWKKTEK